MNLEFKTVSTQEEIQQVSDLAYLLFPADYGTYVRAEHIQYFLDENQSPQAVRDQIANNSVYFLIYMDEKQVGYIGVDIKNEILELSKLYLQHSYRNMGIGAEVLEWLEKYAKKRQIKTIELLVLVNNSRAIQFYKKNGFSQQEEWVKHFFTGYSETNYWMRKNIL